MATPQDLAQTVKEVQALDRHIVATQADVRDYDALKQALDNGVAQLGRLDIVSANVGIVSYGRAEERAEQTWQDVIDTDLTGEWHAAKAAIPHLRAGGHGGSIILTSSMAGLKATQNVAHYVAAKHGVIGLMRTLALELAPDFIRVNALAPTEQPRRGVQHEWQEHAVGLGQVERPFQGAFHGGWVAECVPGDRFQQERLNLQVRGERRSGLTRLGWPAGGLRGTH